METASYSCTTMCVAKFRKHYHGRSDNHRRKTHHLLGGWWDTCSATKLNASCPPSGNGPLSATTCASTMIMPILILHYVTTLYAPLKWKHRRCWCFGGNLRHKAILIHNRNGAKESWLLLNSLKFNVNTEVQCQYETGMVQKSRWLTHDCC